MIFPWDQPGRGFATRPGTRGTNSWGFLEREIPPGRDADVRRVAVLGDSMTYGTGTAAQSWTAAAEQALGPPWQVLNFAHYGYDAEACAATLRHAAARWAPDVVVYAAYTNDLVRNTAIYLGKAPIWIGSTPSALPLSWRRRSALARRIDGALSRGRIREEPDLPHFEAQLADLAAQAEGLGAPLVVFLLAPHVLAGQRCDAPPEFCAAQRAAYEAQRASAARLGLPIIDGWALYRQAPFEVDFPGNSADLEHPGVEGHRWLGGAFAAALPDALGLLPAEAPGL